MSRAGAEVGSLVHLLDPSPSFGKPAYINDHGFAHDGEQWHLFAIAREEPSRPQLERELLHATSPQLNAPTWTVHEPAIVAEPAFGEAFTWAPFAVRGPDRWHLYYAGGGSPGSESAMRTATSSDLWTWTKQAEPAFCDGWDVRDPMVLEIDGRWVMYYTATEAPEGGHHVVCTRESDDLVHWADRRVVFRDPSTGTTAGPTESPFVVEADGTWFLLIGPRGRYDRTAVFVSDDPFHFDITRRAGHLPFHAPEVVTDLDGQRYISACGWGRRGLWLAPIDFTGGDPW